MSTATASAELLTAAQRESIGRFFERVRSLNPRLKSLWVADSEFIAAPGARPVPVCFTFHNPITGETIEQFYRKGEPIPPCPIVLGPDSLLVAFTATAELGSMLALWGRMSCRVVDLDIEWRHINNEEFTLKELKIDAKNSKGGDLSPLGLLGVCAVHGISTRDQVHKDEMRKLILSGGPWTGEQECLILDYCAEDVQDTAALLAAMWHKIPSPAYCRQRIDGLAAALHRGRTMTAFAWMEHIGIPIDVDLNARLSKHFHRVMDDLYGEIREEFPIFNEDSFDIAPSKFAAFLKEKGWLDNPEHPWPMTKGGKEKDKKQPKRDLKGPGGSEGTLPQMALVYPELKRLTSVLEIRSAAKLGLNFPVGPDGRHRVNFWAFGTVTSRCAPSSATYMLAGGSPAFRHLAKPKEGEILIEADWSAQEVWIAAYLSGDPAMQRMLRHADPYLAFGEMAGVIPQGSLEKLGVKECKERFQVERARLKAITLGVLYGKTVYTVARECGITVKEAAALLRTHKNLFPKFWLWIEWLVNESLATRKISTRLGWQRWLLTKKERDERKEEGSHKKVQNSLQNFPMQAHGAEMLRLALVYATEKGLGVCAPLHDAIFAVAPADQEEQAAAALRECMERAAKDIIGVAIPIEMFVTRYPERFVPDDKPMAVAVWDKMMKSLEAAEETERVGSQVAG
jgi:DNA polymerase family A